MTHSTDSEHHHHGGHNEAWLVEILKLDAALLSSYLTEATAWVQQYAPANSALIVDVGTGLGGGSLALAEQFPAAQVRALDKSPLMLDQLRAAATERGLSERIAPVRADLDESWPDVSAADIVWASSSLHEVADPARVFADIFSALNPGGLLALVELDGSPKFLPDDVGLGEPGLERRYHQVLTELGWNRQLDWLALMAQAGFELVAQQGFPSGGQQDPVLARQYADSYLRRIRPLLEGKLAADDLATVDALIRGDDPGALLQRGQLSIRLDRTAWAAKRP